MLEYYQLLIELVLLLFSITVHEYFHGLIAYKYGDDTAQSLGRLTFNPIAHIDLFGTVLLPIMAILTNAPLFGWAKPVPVNPSRLQNPRRDMMFVGLAGPIANFSVAVISSFLLWIIKSFEIFLFMTFLLKYLIFINIILAVFNLIPIPPLDGSNVIAGLLPTNIAIEYQKLTPFGFFIVIFLLMTGILWSILGPIVNFLIHWLGGSLIYV